MRILLIEDDIAAAHSIELALASGGVTCDHAQLGKKGLEISRIYEYDAIILDLMLPDMNGLEVLLRLRNGGIKKPILILSGIVGLDQKINGLNSGADDYLTKPFNGDELVARIKAIIRRSKGYTESIVNFDKVSVNLETRNITVNSIKLHLTNKEYAILELLVLRKDMVTKEELMSHLYTNSDNPEVKIIDVFVCKLRKKLADASGGKNYIETKWGRGYALKEYSDNNSIENQ